MSLPKVAARSIAGAMLLMAFFTWMWVGIATSGLAPLATTLLLLVFVPIGLAVGLNAIHLYLVSGRFRTLSTAADKMQRKRMGIAYGVIFGLEGLLIGAVAGILTGLHKDTYVIPAIAFIVGLHFYPIAKVFNRTIDYYLATWVCVAAGIGVVLAGRRTTAATVSAVVGLGVACATSIYGLYMLRMKRQAVADLRRTHH